MYVAYQTTDDLTSVLQCAGEDNIVIGSDYGHADTASEIEALKKLAKDGSINQAADKILSENPAQLYAIST
jgi:predicted TIM-barrel fold metal-dependent hydrolase